MKSVMQNTMHGGQTGSRNDWNLNMSDNLQPIPPAFPEQPAGMPPKPDPVLQEKKTISAALGTVWIYLGGQAGISLIVGIFMGVLVSVAMLAVGTGSRLQAMEVLTNLIMIVGSVGAGLLAICYGVRRLHISLKQELQESRYPKKELFYGVCLCYGMSIPLGLLTSLLTMLLESVGLGLPEVGSSTDVTFLGNLLYLVMGVIVAPIFEEILFRGMVLSGLKRFSASFALVFSALVFAFAHLNLYQGISVFGMGLAMGFMYLKSGSLQVPIFIHFVNNLIALLTDFVNPIFGIVIEVLILVLMIIGWVYLYKNKGMIRSILTSSPQTTSRMWKCTAKSVSFWLMVALFLAMSILSIIGIA